MNKKMNNKGFSLVELIVVVAIMAILAVTLAPRLTQYVEKSRKASDMEAINTIFTLAKLANVENALPINTTVELTGASGTLLTTSDGQEFVLNTAYNYAGDTADENQTFFDALIAGLKDFNLKSKDTTSGTLILLSTDANGEITVSLDYNPVATDDSATQGINERTMTTDDEYTLTE